ncbi:MAG: DUF2283 domain-containing protein [Polaromonas sp.]
MLCVAAVIGNALVVKTIMHHWDAYAMKSIYFENDDILQIRISDKPIVREVSQDWHTHIGYAEDGTIVEVVLLDARKTRHP